MKLKIKLLIGIPLICVIVVGMIFLATSNIMLKDVGFWLIGIGGIISFFFSLFTIKKDIKANKKDKK